MSLVLSLGAVLVLAATGLALLGVLTVLPVVRAVDPAQRRGCPPARWGLLATVGSAVALVLAAVAATGPRLVGLLAVPAAWVSRCRWPCPAGTRPGSAAGRARTSKPDGPRLCTVSSPRVTGPR